MAMGSWKKLISILFSRKKLIFPENATEMLE